MILIAGGKNKKPIYMVIYTNYYTKCI